MVLTITSVIAWLVIKAPGKRSVWVYLADLEILSIVAWIMQRVKSTEQRTLVAVEFVVLTIAAWVLEKLFLQPQYKRAAGGRGTLWFTVCVLVAFALLFINFLANFYLAGLAIEYIKST